MKTATKTTSKAIEQDHGKEQAKAQLASIIGMTAALTAAGLDDEKREEAETTIHEDPLSVEVRSDWYTLSGDSDKKPAEFKILLCWGGPACQIIGALDEYGQPNHARLQYQDWGTGWTELICNSDEYRALLEYSQCFFFSE
jgi:hypothetical protein